MTLLATDDSPRKRLKLDSNLSSIRNAWTRPLHPFKDLTMQQFEVLDQAEVIQIFGITEDGMSVLVNCHNFRPYLYVYIKGLNNSHLPALKTTLEKTLAHRSNQKFKQSTEVSVELCQKSSIYGYQPSKLNFCKITVESQSQIAVLRRILKEGLNVPGFGNFECEQSFESNIPFVLRFMIDIRLKGASWITIPQDRYKISMQKVSHCNIEVDCDFKDIIAHEPEGEWSKIAPIRILSFDIECAGRPGIFPEAEHDPVIQIANVITIQGQSKPLFKVIFTLDTCAHIVGSEVLSFKEEKDLLQAWSNFVVAADPDIITGYNINGFDLPYLLDRANKLEAKEFAYLGRLINVETKAKDTQFSSKAFGTRNSKQINIEGRVQIDVLQLMQRDHKLRSYSLNNVSAHFLGEQKEDVHYSIITDLQNGTPETRRRLATYCLKDAILPQRLLDKLMCIINYIEMARVTGVNLMYLLTRGQQIKVISQLYRKANPRDLIIPAMDITSTDDQYEGAIVIEPERGYYNIPIATLDFTSLYPSIMMAHNLCYSTWLQDKAHADRYNLVKDKDYIVTPNGDYFLIEEKKKGLLPIILEELLAARKIAKKDLKNEKDPFKRAVLDGRQLALKISANSVYGFTGATIGKLPLLAISSSVTAFGREMIEQTKRLVEEKYTLENGYAHDAKVIYGDTDSVMVRFGVETVKEAMALGREAAEYVTTTFKRPINLDFEKVYYPYLLINKKRYAGLYWTKPEIHDKLDAKGIETVRRDSCRLVSKVIETSLRKLLIDRDRDGAIDFVKDTIAELLQNKVDLSMLVISKALGKADYAAKQAHSELAARMRKRDAGSAPNLGDRVSYVIIKGTKNSAAYEKAEDPIFVLENNLPIDTKYYLEQQLSKPLLRIFEPVLGDKANTLLAGNHTRTVNIAAPKGGAMMRFAKKVETCMSCKAPLRDGGAVCKHCESKLPEILSGQLIKHRGAEEKFASLWTQCQRCQGSLHEEVLCSSQDCPIFYMRRKAWKDLQDSNNTMARFGDW